MSFMQKEITLKKLAMCDLRMMRDPQAVVEVAYNCLKNMLDTEPEHIATAQCVNRIQKEINERMRVTLIGWIVEVHLKFKLLPETLFITVNLVDRYTEIFPVKRSEYQLLGVTSMLIASKY